MPKISIIIPIYNAEKYLKECLDSVVNQTLKDIEIICVNDGSTDNCPKIINEYAKNDSRIVVIDKENAGLGAAYNSGLEIATGEYIGFVEPDDYISIDMYEELYNCTNTMPDIIRSDWFVDINGYIIKQNKYSIYKEGIYKNCDLTNFFENSMGHWSCIYKNNTFLKKYNIKFTPSPGAAYQDIGFGVITNLIASDIYIKPYQYYYYRRHENQSIITTINKKHFKNWITEFNSVVDYFNNNNLAKDKMDLSLLNSYTYKLLNKKHKTLRYIRQISKILNSDLMKEGYNSKNFSPKICYLYNLVLKNPVVAYIYEWFIPFRLLLICYF